MGTDLAVIVLGTVYVQFLEWFLHKYVLHGKGLGKKPNSPFSFHWRQHHRKARMNHYKDDDYAGWPTWSASGKEIAALCGVALLHSPIYFLSPLLLSSLISGAASYYLIHRYSHLHPEWAMKWVPWHYDHHMGKNQDANWGVTSPLFDYILGTREYGPSQKKATKE